ncbi:hypothetical protein KP509_30G016000 [Ceratopteris richardii]|uniref:Uncharacterized protein n=3 Tax=Ceratopteris richardii TaxID=49495 RepID=A0A8T2R037_CERRI|nr:hypothetical protein KP509_30G016000 [Ceratopteris richardii]
MASCVAPVQSPHHNGCSNLNGVLSQLPLGSRNFRSLRQFRNLHSSYLQLPKVRRVHRVLVRASSGPDTEATREESQFGLGGPGTWFGFGRRQERAVGRLAMVGFVAGIVMEILTGKGILAQLGINAVAVKYPFLAGLSFLFVGGLLGGLVVIQNPPDFDKVPPNEGAGVPRDPLKTYDPRNIDPLTTWTRGKKGVEPYASDLDLPSSDKKN